MYHGYENKLLKCRDLAYSVYDEIYYRDKMWRDLDDNIKDLINMTLHPVTEACDIDSDYPDCLDGRITGIDDSGYNELCIKLESSAFQGFCTIRHDYSKISVFLIQKRDIRRCPYMINMAITFSALGNLKEINYFGEDRDGNTIERYDIFYGIVKKR